MAKALGRKQGQIEMTSGNSTSPPVVLLDTCVISGMVRNDMKPEDAAAVVQMAELAAQSKLTMWASTVAREEIDRIPQPYRQDHIDQYDALKKIRASHATWVDTNPASTSFGNVVTHPEYTKLRGLLRDENDARLLFQAKGGGVTDFVTVDYNSVLNKSAELSALGIRALSPAQYMSRST
jgi:hypothetical protein